MSLSFSNEIGNDVRMFRGDIVAFAWIFREIEQERRIVLFARLTLAIGAARDEMRLVRILAYRTELVVPIPDRQPG